MRLHVHRPGAVPAHAGPRATPRSERLDVLDLQRAAGNAAVVRSLGAGGPPPVAIQRQPKPAPPQHVIDAQAEMAAMFGQDPLLGKVVIKDYGTLNADLQKASFGAWTQSVTEIYIKDFSAAADPKKPKTAKWPVYMVRYALHHEAEHVRQFASSTGPPSTWLQMLEFERTAYTQDVTWLAGADAKLLIPDATLRGILRQGAKQNLQDVKSIIASSAKKRPKQQEAARRQAMIAKKLLPATAPADPAALYQGNP